MTRECPEHRLATEWEMLIMALYTAHYLNIGFAAAAAVTVAAAWSRPIAVVSISPLTPRLALFDLTEDRGHAVRTRALHIAGDHT